MILQKKSYSRYITFPVKTICRSKRRFKNACKITQKRVHLIHINSSEKTAFCSQEITVVSETNRQYKGHGEKTMNIVIFTDTYLPKIDGVAVSVSGFVKMMTPKGHRFLIFCPSYPGTDSEESDTLSGSESVIIHRFKSAPLPSYPDIKVVLPSYKKISKALEKFNPDIIHFQTPGILGHFAVIAAHLFNIPCVGTYHTLVSEQDTYLSFYRLLRVDRLYNYFMKGKKIKTRLDKIERKESRSIKKKVILNLANMLYNYGEIIISPSQLIKKELISYQVKKPVVVVSNGIELDKFTGKQRKHPGNAPSLLHVGRISYEKNCEVLLKAFALILKEIPDATLHIIGDGPALPSLRIEAKQLGITDKVSFPGFVKRDDLPEIYLKHDIFLTASTMETQGLVALESAATGLPMIGVDSYALPELIRHNVNGYISQPFDHITMAANTVKLLKSPEIYESFSKHSLEIAAEHDIHTSADKLLSIYQMIIDSSKQQRNITNSDSNGISQYEYDK
jgi:1,2-diacylglycerol 3-alpha-glucosyltransferase